jgi:DNA-binding transcriptional LysR family regulator
MSLDLDAVRAFLQVAELASFTRAGSHLGLAKSRVSLLVRALERELGVSLLQRSTRTVHLTPDGQQFQVRAQRLLAEADELAAMFETPRAVRGQVRADLPIKLASRFVIPRLPEFLAAHPEIEVLLSTTDRRVDVLRDGFDCVLRIGAQEDSCLAGHRLGVMTMFNGASPAYLRRYGTPRTPADLDAHYLVHYALDFGSDTPKFEYRERDGYVEQTMRSRVTVNSADAYVAACLAGLGIIQVPRLGFTPSLSTGEVVEILPDYTCQPMPVAIVHAYGRTVPKRVRLFMTWLAELITPLLSAT